MHTCKNKLQDQKRNRHLQSDTRIISEVHNHFVELPRLHYCIFEHCEGYKRACYNRLSRLKSA